MISRIKKLIENHNALQKKPTSKEDIFNNQKIRYSSVKEIKITDPSQEDKQATQKFWCMQVFFFIRRLHAKKSEIAKIFPDVLSLEAPLSKKNLLRILEKIIEELNKKNLSNEEIQYLIALFIPANTESEEKKKIERDNKISESELPYLYIQKKDSIAFSYEQAVKNKKVLIMDAANTQRPGAGAFEKGTFQEALTRSTDLYWKILVDFRNVLQDLQEQKKTIVKIEEKDYELIKVATFQARFLKLILFFIKKSIEDDSYLEKTDFRKDFFNYADNIFGDIQNRVLEIPSNCGFLKKTCIVDVGKFKNINKTKDLFDEEEIFFEELLKEKLSSLFIAEVAAPDRRYLEGSYDRASTFNKDLQVSHQEQNAAKMIKQSINYTLDQAIKKNVDIIIINGFGCGAFLNSPQKVASIFSEALLSNKLALFGKSIYFMDVSSKMCQIFGNSFSKELRETFNINCYPQGENISLNVIMDELKVESITDENAVMIAAENSKIAKKSFTFFSELSTTAQVRTIKDLEYKPKTKLTLKKAYLRAIFTAIEENKTNIHIPLIGTGHLKFSTLDSIRALKETLQEISEQLSFNVKVHVYIPPKDIDNYHVIVEYLMMSQAVRKSVSTLTSNPAPTNSCRVMSYT